MFIPFDIVNIATYLFLLGNIKYQKRKNMAKVRRRNNIIK